MNDDTSPRVAIIGARRRRQGLGPYIARHFHDAGAVIPCILGTSPQTVATAQRELSAKFGIEARGYVDPATMLANESLDALAILSPLETHREWLLFALEAGLHVLCEKPLMWNGAHSIDATRPIVDRFAEQRLRLWENCQWPYTLPAFYSLYPQTQDEYVRRFFMRMSPSAMGAMMLVDTLPHVLSLLQALVPGDRVKIEGVHYSARGATVTGMKLQFVYVTEAHHVLVEFQLIYGGRTPRVAGYAINGNYVHRLVRTSDYDIFFADGSENELGTRIVDVSDPVKALVRAFVAALANDAGGGISHKEEHQILQRMVLLSDLVQAFGDRADRGDEPTRRLSTTT